MIMCIDSAVMSGFGCNQCEPRNPSPCEYMEWYLMSVVFNGDLNTTDKGRKLNARMQNSYLSDLLEMHEMRVL